MEIEKLYEKYPRKLGKKAGMKKLSKFSDSKLIELNKAIDNYLILIERENIKKEYIKHFSTFVNNYEDYLEVEILNKSSIFSSPYISDDDFYQRKALL